MIAVAFSPQGRHLASYSLDDGTLRIWQTSPGGLLGLFGFQAKCVKLMAIAPPKGTSRCLSSLSSPRASFAGGTSPMAVIQATRLVWLSPRSVVLHRGRADETELSF